MVRTSRSTTTSRRRAALPPTAAVRLPPRPAGSPAPLHRSLTHDDRRPPSRPPTTSPRPACRRCWTRPEMSSPVQPPQPTPAARPTAPPAPAPTFPALGTKVRIERDERRYPSKGTWPQFRGKTGTVVEINLGEIGVTFGKAYPRPDRPRVYRSAGPVTWFQPYEITPL